MRGKYLNKLGGNCAFPQRFHTKKLREITVFYAVYVFRSGRLVWNLIDLLRETFFKEEPAKVFIVAILNYFGGSLSNKKLKTIITILPKCKVLYSTADQWTEGLEQHLNKICTQDGFS